MRAATKDQGFLKEGRGYLGAILELKVAFADPVGSSCFKRASVRRRNQQGWVPH